MPEQYKAACYSAYGGPERVCVRDDLPLPQLRLDTDCLVKVQAASLNPVDYKVMKGGMRPLVSLEMPWVLGFDFSGEVVKLGKACAPDVNVGDLVFGCCKGLRSGTLASYVVVDSRVIAAKPTSLSHEEAAAVPLACLTALQALQAGRPPENGSIFITAGAGGVGSFAIQLARSSLFKCARVITTASSPKEDFVKSLGATENVDYRKQDFCTLSGEKVDMCIDATKEAAKMTRITRKGGCIVSLLEHPTSEMLNTWLDTSADGVSVNPLVRAVARSAPARLFNWVTGANQFESAGFRFEHVMIVPSKEALKTIAHLIDQGEIRVVIDRVFPLEDAKAAVEYLIQNKATGKVVIRV